MTTQRRSRPLVSYLPLTATILGITVVISSVVFFFSESDIRRLVAVTVGLAILISGVWFAANPFLRNHRRYLRLRREVGAFIGLVRTVNAQVVEGEPSGEIEATRAKMHEAVGRIVESAGKEE